MYTKPQLDLLARKIIKNVRGENKVSGCQNKLSSGDVRLSSLQVDMIDFGFLTAARYFFVSFTDKNQSAWVAAVLGSDGFFPDKTHAEAMRLALAVVHEMRTSRRSCFRFSNPRCAGCSAIVTQDERYLLQLVQHARAGRKSQMASTAMMLCEGNTIDRVIRTAEGFAALFPINARQPAEV